MMFSKLVIAAVSPLGTALVLGVLAWLSGLFGNRRLALALGGAALVWLWVWSLPVPSNWLRGHLEAAYPVVPLHAVPSASALVVLGGGISPPQRPDDPPDLGAAADRIWYAARLYHAGKAPLLVLSGGGDPAVSLTSEAAAMRGLLSALGVPERAMVLEEQSRNTRENARFSVALLRERGIGSMVLVTSALHMRRALGLFAAEGMQVFPAATDHEARRPAAWQMWLPDTGALDGSGRAMKEWLGSWSGR